jgi:hypothetical protein
MMMRWMMIGLHSRSGMPIICVNMGRVAIVGQRCVVVIMLCCSRRRRTEGHRRGSEAMKRHRQQRNPDDQDSQHGIHAPILAHAKVSELPRLDHVL